MWNYPAFVLRLIVAIVLAVLAGAPLLARQAASPELGVSLSDSRLSTGEPLTVRVTVTNTGFGAVADFYFVILLPDGSTVVSAGPGIGARFGRFSDLRTLVPVAGGIGLASPFTYENDTFFEYAFNGSEPPGLYRVYFAALSAGALADGAIGGGELIALATTEFTVAPAVTTVTDPSRTSTATIPTTGGQVATTASNGLAYTLAFPAGAVATATNVSITPLVSASNLPGSGSFVLGLRAEPSGLSFDVPATLSIALPAGMPVANGGYAAIVTSDQGRRIETVPVALTDRTLSLRVPHFSDIVLLNNFLGICAGRLVTRQMEVACQLMAAALILVDEDVTDPNFRAYVLDVALTDWSTTGLRSRFDLLVGDEVPAGRNRDDFLDDVQAEWIAWAAAYSIVAGPIRTFDRTRPLAAIVEHAYAALAFGTKFAQERANARCLADKPFARVHVQRVSALDFLFQSTFDEPNPFPTEYCLGLVIDAAPLPVLTPGVDARMPIAVRLMFTDNVEATGLSAQAVLTITATSATVTPGGGVVALPLVRDLIIRPTTTSSVITITAAVADPVPFDDLPLATRTVNAGAASSGVAATQLRIYDALTETDVRYNDAAPTVATGTVGRTLNQAGITAVAGRRVDIGADSMSLTGSVDRQESVQNLDAFGVFSEANIVLDLETTTTFTVVVSYSMRRREGSGSANVRFSVSNALTFAESLSEDETAKTDTFSRTITLPPGVHGLAVETAQNRGVVREMQSWVSAASMTLTRVSGTP